MTDYIRLDYWDLGLAALLLVAVAAISLLLQLKIERRLLWAGLRCALQLALVGLVLTKLFELEAQSGWKPRSCRAMISRPAKRTMASAASPVHQATPGTTRATPCRCSA